MRDLDPQESAVVFFQQANQSVCCEDDGILARLREGLDTPSQWRAPQLLRATSLRLIKGGRQGKEDLAETLEELQRCNRTRTAPAQRITEAEEHSQLLWPDAERLIDQQARDRRGLPERPVQGAKLDQLRSCIAEIIAAYQLALADDYACANSGANPQRERQRMQLCAVRILEWTWRELELYRLRYQPLPGNCWQRANRVFFAIRASIAADTPVPTVVAPDFLADANGQITLERLYLNIQALGLFDAFSWPKATQGFIARYCALVPDGLRLIREPEGGHYQRFIHADHAGPPSASDPSPAPGHGATPADGPGMLVIDYSALASAVRADQHAFFRRDPNGTRSPDRLRSLPAASRRPSIRLLARDMDNGAPSEQPEQPLETPEPLYLSAGMTTIRALLHQVFSRFPHSQSPSSQPRTRRDPLQQPKNLRTSGDAWQLVRQSARLWRIQSPSSQTTTALNVGTLVAFGSGKAGLARPRLGRIARMLRTSQTLQIDLQELACFAAPISLQKLPTAMQEISSQEVSGQPAKAVDNSGDSSSSPRAPDGKLQGASTKAERQDESISDLMRALLIYDEDFGWGIMTPPQQQFREGDAIAIRTRRLNVESRLRSIRDATQDFLLFQINPHDPHLGVPSYPRSHRARRRVATHPPRPRPIDSQLNAD